jgi:hypothetical protein
MVSDGAHACFHGLMPALIDASPSEHHQSPPIRAPPEHPIRAAHQSTHATHAPASRARPASGLPRAQRRSASWTRASAAQRGASRPRWTQATRTTASTSASAATAGAAAAVGLICAHACPPPARASVAAGIEKMQPPRARAPATECWEGEHELGEQESALPRVAAPCCPRTCCCRRVARAVRGRRRRRRRHRHRQRARHRERVDRAAGRRAQGRQLLGSF